jgi:hypothetical protein
MVNKWSDVVFIEWQHQALGLVRELNWVLRYNVKTRATQRVMNRAFARRNPEWPGVTFAACGENGLALIGTVHGLGVAWLLATHKEQFGLRTIASVRVWTTVDDDEEYKYYMLFKIVPLSETNQRC